MFYTLYSLLILYTCNFITKCRLFLSRIDILCQFSFLYMCINIINVDNFNICINVESHYFSTDCNTPAIIFQCSWRNGND